MTAALVTGAGQTSVPTFPRLLRVEFTRIGCRRFVRIASALALIGLATALVLLYVKHGRATASELANATRQRDAQIAQIQQTIAQCAQGIPSNEVADRCGIVPTPDEFPPDQFISTHPFDPSRVQDYALAIGAATALIGFALGATFIGAEWSTKNLVAWLFWEPRRLRLITAKLLALLSVALAVAVVAQLIWYVAAHLLIHYRGLPVSSASPLAEHFWRHVIDSQARAVLLVLPTAALGFGLANLVRNTAASVGLGFVYFAVVESLIRSINPNWQPYLLTTNLGAWVSSNGITVYGTFAYDQRAGGVIPDPIDVSNLHGAVVLLIYSGVVLLVSIALFRRRDIA